jgi:WD40 repeat protein
MFMVHESQVLALDFSQEMTGDKLMLASGDQQGVIKVWKVTNGKCLRSIELGLADGKGAVTVVRFMQSDTKLITVSADM